MALDALLDERNVTRAAKRLNLSQPAMSAQLSRLRALFEDELLVPSGRSMVPTARASALQGPLHELLEQLSTLIAEQQVFDPTTAQRTFRIIAADYVHTVVSVPLLHTIQKIAPGIRVVLPFEPATAWLQLERSEADLLFTAWREVTPEAARGKPLYTDTLCLLQRIGHPRGKGKVTIDELCSLDHITISPEGGPAVGAARRSTDVGRAETAGGRIGAVVPDCSLDAHELGSGGDHATAAGGDDGRHGRGLRLAVSGAEL